MKLFVRFLLSLCFLLVGGNGNPYGQGQQKYDSYAHIQQAQKVRAHFKITGNLAQRIHYSPFQVDQKHTKGIAADNEDEDDSDDDASVSLKGHATFSSYLASFFYLKSPGDFCCFFKNRLFFDEHVPHCSTSSYITLRVIRV